MNKNKDKKKLSRKSIFIIAFFCVLILTMVIGGFIVLYKKQHEYADAIRVKYDDETFTLIAPTETRTFSYEQVGEFVFMKNWFDCTLISGEESTKVASGIFQVDEGEQFTMHTYKDVAAYIILYYQGEGIVFNLYNAQDTIACYDYLKHKVFDPQISDTPIPEGVS